MRALILDTLSGESVWSEDHEVEEFTDGSWACDCLRAHLHNPRKTRGCFEGGECLGYERFLVTFALPTPDHPVETDDDFVFPSLHELNASYPEELLYKNSIPLD